LYYGKTQNKKSSLYFSTLPQKALFWKRRVGDRLLKDLLVLLHLCKTNSKNVLVTLLKQNRQKYTFYCLTLSKGYKYGSLIARPVSPLARQKVKNVF
jgi:hypothetical protein